MRLIDADLLMRKCEKWLKPKAPDEDEMVSLADIAVSMLMEIEEQPTAFDAKNVIVELACNECVIAVSKYTGKPVSCYYTACGDCGLRTDDIGTCRGALKEWAESEYIEKPVISKRDRAFLECIREEYKFVARDENGKLFVYKTQPRKMETRWVLNCDGYLYLNRYFNVDFPMVKWSNEEPWLIKDLKKLEVVEEYEK